MYQQYQKLKLQKESNSIPLTQNYITAHFTGLVQSLTQNYITAHFTGLVQSLTWRD